MPTTAAIALKPHWITTLTRIADAGRNGICVASSDRRAAEALRARGLVDTCEKLRYAGLNEPPRQGVIFHLLTNAGREWLVQYRENPIPARGLPAGWRKADGGGYIHTASRIEVRRDGRQWGVLRPLGPVTETDPMYSVVDIKTTRADAFAAAAPVITRQLELVKAATFEETGRPETWPAGQVDEPTVNARHLAVHASGTRTGYQAKPGDRVIHLELGDRGFYSSGEGDCSYVRFDGETGDHLVHSNDLVVIVEPHTVQTMAVTREPKYADYTSLGGPNEPGEDYILFVDGQRIGGTYWCSATDIPDGQRWASWGVAGLSMRHPRREAAEQAQVRAYVANPSLYDRLIADEEKEAAARRAEREAEQEAEWARRDEQRRIEREGADGPGLTVWELPAYHYLIAADLADVHAVKAWLDAHDLEDVSGVHPIRIEQRAERRVIVFEKARFGGLSAKTETWAVTCVQDPPDVDLTPRPDLVELLETHHPVKFPLIDFGQSWACSACTRALGSASEIIAWECAVFQRARQIGAARIALDAAEREAVAAEAACQSAAVAGRDTTPEQNLLRAAEINFVRRRLAMSALVRDPAQDAEVRLVMVSCSDDDGSTWTPFHWLGVSPLDRETASAQALRYAVSRGLAETPTAALWDLTANPRPWRVEVFTDPMATHPDGVWTNLTNPCRAGRHHPGAHPVTVGPARPGGGRVEVACCARCFHRVWRLTAGVWLLEGEPLGPDNSPDPDSDPDSHSDPDPTGKIDIAMGPSPSTDDVSLGYRIQTRTGRRWRTVRVGNTPPMYRPDPTVLWAAADTILGNARQALGLGPKDPLPGVRVWAWDRQTGLTRFATRRAARKVNQRAQ